MVCFDWKIVSLPSAPKRGAVELGRVGHVMDWDGWVVIVIVSDWDGWVVTGSVLDRTSKRVIIDAIVIDGT